VASSTPLSNRPAPTARAPGGSILVAVAIGGLIAGIALASGRGDPGAPSSDPARGNGLPAVGGDRRPHDPRRDDKLRKAVRRAQTGELGRARDEPAKVLERDPDDPEARAILQQIEGAARGGRDEGGGRGR